MTDHPDRNGRGDPNAKGFNGEWMTFNQDEPPNYPGEVGNDPFGRSVSSAKAALMLCFLYCFSQF